MKSCLSHNKREALGKKEKLEEITGNMKQGENAKELEKENNKAREQGISYGRLKAEEYIKKLSEEMRMERLNRQLRNED